MHILRHVALVILTELVMALVVFWSLTAFVSWIPALGLVWGLAYLQPTIISTLGTIDRWRWVSATFVGAFAGLVAALALLFGEYVLSGRIEVIRTYYAIPGVCVAVGMAAGQWLRASSVAHGRLTVAVLTLTYLVGALAPVWAALPIILVLYVWPLAVLE